MTEEEERTLQEEFRASWRYIEVYLDEGRERNHLYLVSFIALVHEVQSLGYDKYFRASFENNSLIISRSRQSNSANYLLFRLTDDGGLLFSAHIEGQKIASQSHSTFPTAISPELKTLLDLLMAQPID